MTTTLHPVPVPRGAPPSVRPPTTMPPTTVPPSRSALAVAALTRRALPALTGSVAALLATVAAERTVRRMALGALEGLGWRLPDAPRGTAEIVRTVVTEVTAITIVERGRRL